MGRYRLQVSGFKFQVKKNVLMAEFIKIYEDKPSEAAIKKVAEVLRNGGLVIYPTDTVYGIGCDITNSRALERLAKLVIRQDYRRGIFWFKRLMGIVMILEAVYFLGMA